MYPKVLVISNECFSHSSANGRTLGNFFVEWPKENLVQFFISGTPDFDYCENYYKVSDRDALKAFFEKTEAGNVISGKVNEKKSLNKQSDLLNNQPDLQNKQKGLSNNQPDHDKKPKRNALTMLIRNFVWKNVNRKNKNFWNWVCEFNPDIVLLQAGDCAFMYDLAAKAAVRFNAKLVMYNSEGYYYKDFDYFRGKGIPHLLYPVFRKNLKKSLEKAYNITDHVIYCCEELKVRYDKDFNVKSDVIYTSSDVKYAEKETKNSSFIVSYAGNLGLKRHESLIEIANVLQEISKEIYLDVYGKATADVTEAFGNCAGISYHGVVSYDEVQKIMRESDLLLHVESFDSFYRRDLEFGFSTKIADSLASGNCFLIYAPDNLACTKYLIKNEAAYVATNRKELKNILTSLTQNPKSRVKYHEKALEIVVENHNPEKNGEKFKNILLDVVKSHI